MYMHYGGISMNSVNLIGRLTKDVELKTFGKGKESGAVARVTLAIRDGKDAEGEERTQFISCTLWNKTAEIAAEYCAKGDQVAVSGRLVNNNYEKDGQMVYQTEVVVNNLELIGGRRTEDAEESRTTKKSKKSYK